MDEKGLDLSLGLPCGGGSSSLKGKSSSSADIRSDEGDRGSKLINEFKNFLEGGIQPHSLKAEENYYNFSKSSANLETSSNSNAGGRWMITDNRSTEVEEEKISGVGEKRKNLSIDANQQKKLERDINHPDFTEKTRISYISITTDEGSTADNEDVADSEVDGSTSRHVSQHDEVSKRFAASSNLNRVQKDITAFGETSGGEILGQKRFSISENLTHMAVPYSVSFPAQSGNVGNMSYSQPAKDSNISGRPSLSSYPLPGIMHTISGPNSERPAIQPVGPANFPLMFGYSPLQLPALDKESSRAFVSQHQQIHPSHSGSNPIPSDSQNDSRKLTQANVPVISQKASESAQYDGRAVEQGKNNGKQHIGEEGSSSYAEGELKANHIIHPAKEAATQPAKCESFPSEFPAIRPGIAADLKFGGCGTYPNLPWVSTTGQGPNGKTISGVTYRYSSTQIRIVCACHGTHLSPEEFVQHATEGNSTPDSGGGLTSFPSSNPTASA